MAEAARQRKPTRDMVEGIQRYYFSELLPSDNEPSSIGEHLRTQKLAKRLYPKGLVVKGETFDGPHYRAALDYLGHFADSPHDREIWAVFHWWSRPCRDDWPLIEEKAETEGLTAWELIYRETLKALRRYVRSKGIPELGKPAQTRSDAADSEPSTTKGNGRAARRGRSASPEIRTRNKRIRKRYLELDPMMRATDKYNSLAVEFNVTDEVVRKTVHPPKTSRKKG